MKRNLALVSVLLLTISAFSQNGPISVGISSGVSISTGKVQQGISGDYGFVFGPAFEASISLDLGPHFFLLSEIGYLQRGYKYSVENSVSTITDTYENSYFGIVNKNYFRYLNSDWQIGFKLGKEIEFCLSIGVFLSYYLNTKHYSLNYSYFDPIDHAEIGDLAFPIGYTENESQSNYRNGYFTDWDYGFSGRLCIGYQVSELVRLSLFSKYQHGMKDISAIDNPIAVVSIFNRSIISSLGIQIRL